MRRALGIVAVAVIVAGGACSSSEPEPGAAPGTTAVPTTVVPGTTPTTVPETVAAAPEPEPVAAGILFRDPDMQVGEWVAAHPDDPRMPAIRDRIAAQPQARWFTDADPATIAGDVRAYVDPAAGAGQVPVLVLYAIPDRDCGGASHGGADAFATWQDWIAGLAEGLGDQRALLVMEPDALAQEDCLDAAGARARHAAIAAAVATLRDRAPAAELYLDAGHSNWQQPAEQARRLREAGVLDAAGFATNVSNFNTTADEIAYGQALIDELDAPDLRQVIDVSRNGNGPAPDAAWCDPPGRAIGQAPTLDTGVATVAAYLWVKPPGEADGCAATPGDFIPDLAHALATG